MKPSMYQYLVSNIKKHEGFKAEAYIDSLGYPTFGYGSRKIREKYADMNMQDDLKECICLIEGYIQNEGISLDEFRICILSEMAYQLGFQGVLGFKKMWKAIREMDYAKASEEMKASRWHKQTPARCEYLAGLMLRGG